MVKGTVPTADVLRAIRLMLSTADDQEDSDNDAHHREIAPAEEGWFLPRDLTKSLTLKHFHYEERVNAKLPKACAPTATTRLRKRLEEWNIIETKPGQRKDSKGRLLENPPVFIRLRRDVAGIRKIESLLFAAQTIHQLKPLSGLTRKDIDNGNLAVFNEWLQPEKHFVEERKDAALDSLYIRYRYHTLTLKRFNLPGFDKRLREEIRASKDLYSLQEKASHDYMALRKTIDVPIQKENPTQRIGIQLSRKSPPDREDSVMGESSPIFFTISSPGVESPFKSIS